MLTAGSEHEPRSLWSENAARHHLSLPQSQFSHVPRSRELFCEDETENQSRAAEAGLNL